MNSFYIAILILLPIVYIDYVSASRSVSSEPDQESNTTQTWEHSLPLNPLEESQENDQRLILNQRASHCIQTPKSLSFCSSSFGWASNMRLPNQLGHRSASELENAILSQQPISTLLNSFKNESKLDCKIEHVKLMLCTIIAPPCLGVNLKPCGQLCLTARGSCKHVLHSVGVEWPKFFDCKKFPRQRSDNICIRQQPALHSLETVRNSSSEILDKSASQTEVCLQREATTTTATPLASTSTKRIKTKRRRKDKTSNKKRYDANATTTTTTSSLSPYSTTLFTSPVAVDLSEPTTATPSTTVSEKVAVTTEMLQATTTVAPSSAKPSEPLAKKKILSGTSGHIVTDRPEVDYSSMPINVIDDLTQLLCSNSPDWLIKAKLTDNQLVMAVKRRKIKIRSYRQIFDRLVSSEQALNVTDTPTINSRSNSSSISSSGRRGIATNLHLTLPNSTVFVTAIGSTMYAQPLTEALSRASESQSHSSNQHTKSTGRTYLISGSGGSNSTGNKLTSVFVVWPGSRSNIDPKSRANLNIIKTYRDFKLRGFNVCQSPSPATAKRSPNHFPNNTSMLTTESSLPPTSNSPSKASNRSRASKQTRKTSQQP